MQGVKFNYIYGFFVCFQINKDITDMKPWIGNSYIGKTITNIFLPSILSLGRTQ